MTEEEKEQLKAIEKSSGFIKLNKYHVLEIAKGEKTVMEADITEDSLNPFNFAHGGFIFGLGDTAMGVVARTTGRNAVTLSSNITYLKPSTGKYLIAKAEMIKNGKTTCYLRTNIYNDKDILVATMDANYYYIS